jgi:phage shock protein PspC (stress-responsive transcriptional regulator)
VCGGLAAQLGWRPAVVRILFVLIAALPIFPGIVVYAVLWFLVPLEEPGRE